MIYCNNSDCHHYEDLKEKYLFKYHKAYQPIGDTGYFHGKCKIYPGFQEKDLSNLKGKFIYAICDAIDFRLQVKCNRECLWNCSSYCKRNEICVDLDYNHKVWVCRCFSNKHISGHMDWSRFGSLGHQDGHTSIPD